MGIMTHLGLSHGPAVPANGNSVSDKVSPRGDTDPTKLSGLKITVNVRNYCPVTDSIELKVVKFTKLQDTLNDRVYTLTRKPCSQWRSTPHYPR